METDYSTLGLDKFATYTEIKNAYRQKILLYHPDKLTTTMENNKTNSPNSTQFIKIKQAYDNILRSIKRGKGKYKNIQHCIKLTPDMANDMNKIEFKRLRYKMIDGHYKEYMENKTILIPPNIYQIIYKDQADQPVGYEIPGDLILNITIQ